mgnify:CR=1 FL=1
MAQTKYGAATSVLILNALQFTDFSADETPIEINSEEDFVEFEIMHGGGSVRTDRKATLLELRVSLQPGTEQSNTVRGWLYGKTDVEGSFANIGTAEKFVLSGGACVNFDRVGRGFKPTADVYIFKFTKHIGV